MDSLKKTSMLQEMVMVPTNFPDDDGSDSFISLDSDPIFYTSKTNIIMINSL